MPAKRKNHDLEKLSKTAVKHMTALAKQGEKPTAETVVKTLLTEGVEIAPTTLTTLLKQLSDSDKLDGFYLKRGCGFVHENNVPRKKRAKRAAKRSENTVISPDLLSQEIDEQERVAAEQELRDTRRVHWRKHFGLVG